MTALWITGTGAVGPCGLGLPEDGSGESARGHRLVPEGLPLKEGFPAAAMRWQDASSLWWINAARQALGAEGACPETGQVVGLGWGSNPPVMALAEQAHRHGFSAMAPSHFPYSVGNAPSAQAGILLHMRGPAVTLCAKESAGLAALAEGARCLSAGLCSELVAGGVDHLDPFLQQILRPLRRGSGVPAGEGAYALKLQCAREAPARAQARVAAWTGLSAPAPPHLFPEASPILGRTLDSLLARAGWEGASVDLAVLPEDTPVLKAASDGLRSSRLPAAAPFSFQRLLGACGASWAGAAGLVSRRLASGSARRAVLLALATGGACWAVALEAPRAQ